MRKTILVFAIFSAMSAVAQSTADEVVLTIDNEKISRGEFERQYKKNNSDISFDSSSLAEYMRLFIDYKLKVIEAEAVGLDTTFEFKNELDGYCAQLEKPYFTDSRVDDSLAREAYDHMHWDVRASHILINCAENASAADTLKAYKRIQSVYQRALKGEDFAKLARENSDDPSASRNGGDLGYFTAFSMIYEFEKVAYATKVSDVSPIFRTRFGYHILKVFDRRTNPGQIRAAHIMVRVDQNADEAAQKAAVEKVNMIADSLAAGSDWAQMVNRYTDDRGTRAGHGDLNWFSTGMMVPEFESAAFALKNVGDISAPVRTMYGWHIIKLLDKKSIDSFENLQEQIKKRLSRDVRSQMAQEAVLESLKREYKFTEDKSAYKEFVGLVDTTIWSGSWSADKAKGYDKVIFSFADTVKFTQADYAKKVVSYGVAPRNVPIDLLMKRDYDRIVEKMIFDYERKQLVNKYPEYKYLKQEYHDGILLFALMDKMVWTKAATDSAGQERFYEANKQKYMWDDRAEVAVSSYNGIAFVNDLSNIDAKLAQALKTGTKKGDYAEQSKAALQKIGIAPDSVDLQVTVKKYNIVDIDGAKYCDIDGAKIHMDAWGKSKTKKLAGKRFKVLYLVKKVPAMPKTLEECRGAVIADYQNQLETEWVEQLRAKHTVKINESVFNSMIKR
ncbi:MAG: peptidylprolyl isomerase [Salinivirgaceae bacterium]|nr:peptidylprolyl isomerase [Salinivirgaceae bacterium]